MSSERRRFGLIDSPAEGAHCDHPRSFDLLLPRVRALPDHGTAPLWVAGRLTCRTLSLTRRGCTNFQRPPASALCARTHQLGPQSADRYGWRRGKQMSTILIVILVLFLLGTGGLGIFSLPSVTPAGHVSVVANDSRFARRTKRDLAS